MKLILRFMIALSLIHCHCLFSEPIPIISLNDLIEDIKISEAIQCGIFYLEIPNECKEHIDDALKFSYRFPNDPDIKKYTDGKFGGYHDREHDQIESFYVERKDWNLVLPTKIQNLAVQMNYLSNIVLKAALRNSDIPQQLWSEGTGLITEDDGQYHFSFNHYRCEKEGRGIQSHQDFGFVSILFVEKPGLEAFYKEQWVEIPPLKDHFIVILGKAFEILVNDVSKLSGAWHQVRHLSEERVSFAITCDNDENQGVKRYLRNTNQLETVFENYQDYLTDCFKQAYLPETPDVVE